MIKNKIQLTPYQRVKFARKLTVIKGSQVFNWLDNKIERVKLDNDLTYSNKDVLRIEGNSVHFKTKNDMTITCDVNSIITGR